VWASSSSLLFSPYGRKRRRRRIYSTPGEKVESIFLQFCAWYEKEENNKKENKNKKKTKK
jgi:hypothetical protein